MKNWISADILPKWVGFAWFGWLKLKNIRNGKIIECVASGVYIENGRNIEFKLENFPQNERVKDYEITHYITRFESEINLFNV